MTGAGQEGHPRGARIEGPWPFVTRYSYRRAGKAIVWLARRHRKGLDATAPSKGAVTQPFWQRPGYNWSTGAAFAIGSFLFMLGSVLTLLPAGIAPSGFAINVVFFSGSIPFTIAGYMQHFQAANAAGFAAGQIASRRRIVLVGWNPRSIGWLSTFTQFIGTVAFNISTFDAIVTAAGWRIQDIAVWTPDMVGSTLFLVSGYLAFVESSHGYWSWQPRDLAWQIVFVNLLGCIFFMTAGILSYVPPGSEPSWIVALSNVHLLLGALGFLVGALLTMREARS